MSQTNRRQAPRRTTRPKASPDAPKMPPTRPERTPSWEQMEKELERDTFSVWVELEMRRALLDSNRFPPLREMLETEIAEHEKRFEEVTPMYLAAKEHADRERANREQRDLNPEKP